MKRILIGLAVGSAVVASPAAANHPSYETVPFDSRGSCESEKASLSNNDDWLLTAFPQLFSSEGEVRSFLNRAFACEQRGGDWYITDHRLEVLGSEWFKRRL